MKVRFDPTDTPGLERLEFRNDDVYLLGNVGPSDLIADMFGSSKNVARWNFLRSLKAPTAWLDELRVRKGIRGKGIGTKFFTDALKVLRESGVRYVILSPRAEGGENYEGLERFYKRFGFTEVREFNGQPLWSRLLMMDFGA